MTNKRHTIVFFVNQGESRICENREIFTLKNKILSPKEIKQGVHQSKERLFSFTGICALLSWVVYVSCYAPLKAPPINGPLWGHVLVDLPIIAQLAPPNELRHCYRLGIAIPTHSTHPNIQQLSPVRNTLLSKQLFN